MEGDRWSVPDGRPVRGRFEASNIVSAPMLFLKNKNNKIHDTNNETDTTNVCPSSCTKKKG